MEYARWAPRYEAIRAEFGFPFDREEAAARELERLLPEPARDDPMGRLRACLRDRTVIVAGLAPSAGPPPVWRLAAEHPAPAIVAADGATADCLRSGLIPNVVATDLDGPVASEVTANRKGSLVVIHAHGDNLGALTDWVPEFPGALVGSWAGPPRGPLIDVGGFTDGDRAAYLAEAAGARRILLWGFDFLRVEEADPTSRQRKLAKLAWADRLLAELDRVGGSPLFLWQRDGSLDAYPGGRSVASTR